MTTKKVMEKYHIEGLVQVFGSPDEERMGGKIELVEAGYVKYPDVCLMTHPGNHENAFMRTLALQAVSVHYYGKATHAAISPWEGINALDAVVQSYQAIAMHRNQMNPSTQIHGIITDGGQVTNVIPKHASAHYFMRSENKAALKELQQKVTSIFEGVAQTTGCQVRLTWDPMYAEMKVNSLLASQYQRYMERLYQYTFPDLETQREHATGSTDMGNVSQVKPSIHTSYGIGVESRCNLHTDAFRQACQTSVAHEQTWKSATGLALVALRVLDDEEFCDQVAQEFHGQR
ncbi:hypothetical protein H4R35_006603 [Dimargaris xerosporica]|nr:hypothetical protein H4R35_006603 [Dimargaris xerosporica]